MHDLADLAERIARGESVPVPGKPKDGLWPDAKEVTSEK